MLETAAGGSGERGSGEAAQVSPSMRERIHADGFRNKPGSSQGLVSMTRNFTHPSKTLDSSIECERQFVLIATVLKTHPPGLNVPSFLDTLPSPPLFLNLAPLSSYASERASAAFAVQVAARGFPMFIEI